MSLFVGIDGGATKTRVVVADADGVTLAQAQSAASNYQIVGTDAAARHLSAGLIAAFERTPYASTSVAGIAAGFAGLDGPADVEAVSVLMARALTDAGLSAPWWAVNDAVVAWAGALGGRPGVIVISGSGAIALAVNENGDSVRSDGLGHWLGDEGSGFDIGRRGLQAAVRAAEGRGAETALLGRLERRHVGEEGWRAWISALNAMDGERAHAQIASFAPDVVQTAAQGDAVAREILGEAGRALAHTAYSALCRAGLTRSPKAATVGSLFAHSLILRDFFSQTLCRLLPGAAVHWPQMQPAEGAVLLARKPALIPKDN